MHVSFIVPLYNCLELTRAMVGSLQASLPKGLDHEIILVDDGSTDGTRAWLAGLKNPFRVILNERNLGFAAANNRGSSAARGELLVLLNNDLVLGPGWLEPMLEGHRQLGPRAGLVGNIQLDARTGKVDHAGIFINHKGKPEHIRVLPRSSVRRACPVREVSLLTGACVLISRRLWIELRGFDEGYRNGCEDVDLCLRAIAAGKLNAVALQSRVRHHISTTPGRKTHDEANTYRFTLRWRDTLAVLGLRGWCRHHVEEFMRDPRDFSETRLALGLAAYLSGLRREPPAEAREGIRQALDLELARWRALFGDGAPGGGSSV